MIKTIGFCEFCDEFYRMGRSDQFSYEAKRQLFDWYEDNEPEYDLDVIAICCEWAEDSVEEALNHYDLESIEQLRDNTYVFFIDEDTVLYMVY